MHNSFVNILFIADIVGKPGLEIVRRHISNIKAKHNIDFCIANGENGAGGKGITETIAREYFSIGINVITGGNHIFEKSNAHKFLNENRQILRPLNYPPQNLGRGSNIYSLANGVSIGVINAQGRTFMYSIDCPFRALSEEVNRIRQHTNILVVDFHAEATAEKLALGYYLDGKVSAVIGTHTHVQTADEQIFKSGTAYITDAGMTGPFESVIGLQKEVAIRRFITQIPSRYQVADGPAQLCAVTINIDTKTGKAQHIERILIRDT